MSSASMPETLQLEQTNTHPKPSRPRTLIARYDQYFDLRTFSTTLRKTNKPPKVKDGKKPVLTIRRIIDDKGRYAYTEVDIMSPRLRDIFAEINRDVLSFSLSGAPATIDPNVLFHSRGPIRELLAAEQVQERPDEALIVDLKTTIEYTHEYHHDALSEFEGLLEHQEVSFKHLWTIFPPNTYVYHKYRATDQDQILYARSFKYITITDYKSDVKTRFGVIQCEFITHDGNMFGLSRRMLTIKEYPGVKTIQDLDVFPLEFHPQKIALRERAIKRGEKFVAIVKCPSYNEVTGLSVIEVKTKPSDEYNPDSIYDEVMGPPRVKGVQSYGRLMIDPTAFRIHNPDTVYNYDVLKSLDPDNLTEEQHLICSPFVLGFCFGTKIWGGFALDRVHDIVWSDEPFDSLVLGSKQKTLIHALVKQHAKRTKIFDDIVRGKGKGLIGLLAGKPGCGKTLTAEAVAETTRRPLYVVSAGELGTSPEQLEKQLQKVLELAHTWDAVLLLDEAEVFLQARSTNDITRNALVSIFLRELEYYQGVLILTTNLAAQFDPAMESRIHFCVHYPDLNQDARRQIWATFLAKSTLDSTHGLNDDVLDRLSQIPLNGRQIKNAVSSAQSIALQHEKPLSIDHINTVMEVLSEWQEARDAGSS